MFGAFTDKLALVGVAAIVFWIICWLVLLSKNDSLPGWISSLSAIVAGLLAFCTAISTALFAIPLYILYQQAYSKIKHEGFQEGLKIGEKMNKKQ